MRKVILSLTHTQVPGKGFLTERERAPFSAGAQLQAETIERSFASLNRLETERGKIDGGNAAPGYGTIAASAGFGVGGSARQFWRWAIASNK